MSTDELLSFAENHGHMIYYMNLQDIKAVTLEDDDSFIALSNALHGSEVKEIAAHELGHCEYGGFYNRYSAYDVKAKAEYRADKWAYSKIVPIRAVRRAMKKGVQTHWELADTFGVSCEYMWKVLEHYRAVGLL